MASPNKMRVVLLASEWRTKRDELSTFNRELAIQLAKHPDVQVSVFLPRCDQDEKNEALSHKITLVQAKRRRGFDDETQWLCFPPKDLQIDFVIGHGVELGHQAQVIQENRSCKWVQFVYNDPEERGMLKDCPDAISDGEKKRRDEVDLCVSADFVVAVGSKVAEAYRPYFHSCDKDQNVFVLTPGIFTDFSNIAQSSQDGSKCRVLALGHGSAGDFSLKGFDIAAKAVAKFDDAHLIVVGAEKQDEVAGRLKEYNIPPSRLRVRERFEKQFSEVDLVIMPSRTEGFGLIALEAISAGLPVLVSANSGLGEAMKEVAFGSQYVIDSEDAEMWAAKIKEVWTKRREIRQRELKAARDSYAADYNWEEQCRDLVERMRRIVNDPVGAGVTIPEETEQQPADLSGAVNQLQLIKESQTGKERNVSKANEEGAVSAGTAKRSGKRKSQSNSDQGVSEEGASPTKKEPPSISGTIPNLVASPVEQQAAADKPHAPSKQQPPPCEETKASGTNEDTLSLSKESVQVCSKHSISGSTHDLGALIRLVITTQDLNDEQQEMVNEILTRQVQVYVKHHNLSTAEGVGALIEYIIKAYHLALESVYMGSLELILQCPTLENLKHLWSDHLSGHLDKVAERYLATDEIKRKLKLETVKFKTTIQEENYLTCKKALVKMTGVGKSTRHEALSRSQGSDVETKHMTSGIQSAQEADEKVSVKKESQSISGTIPKQGAEGSTDFPSQQTTSDEGASTRRTDTSSDFQGGKEGDTSWMARAEKAKASRNALHKASIRGQCETIRMLLGDGEDVDQRDQFSLTPLHLACWYGQESVVRLLLEHGANVNAVDRFQRTPLQKAKRHNHQSIVKLLLKNNASPIYQQPLSLKSLSRKAFLQVDRRSGFNLLQAAFFEGDCNTVWKVQAVLVDYVKEMNFETTSSDAKLFPGVTAVDILLSLDTKKRGHDVIDELYQEAVEICSTMTELHRCVRSDDAEKAVELVVNDGVDINIPALCNRTPLLWASPSSSSMLIKTLIDLGADVNAQRTDDKVAPLRLAASWNNYMATRLLLEHGADVSRATGDGRDAADMARLNEETEIEEYLRSKVASSHRTEGKEVEQDVTYAYILSDAYSYSFGSSQYIYSLSEDLKSLSL